MGDRVNKHGELRRMAVSNPIVVGGDKVAQGELHRVRILY